MFMLVVIKAYVGKATVDLEQKTINGPEVAKFLIEKLFKLKYGVGMLLAQDIHVDQIGIVLRGIVKYG